MDTLPVAETDTALVTLTVAVSDAHKVALGHADSVAEPDELAHDVGDAQGDALSTADGELDVDVEADAAAVVVCDTAAVTLAVAHEDNDPDTEEDPDTDRLAGAEPVEVAVVHNVAELEGHGDAERVPAAPVADADGDADAQGETEGDSDTLDEELAQREALKLPEGLDVADADALMRDVGLAVAHAVGDEEAHELADGHPLEEELAEAAVEPVRNGEAVLGPLKLERAESDGVAHGDADCDLDCTDVPEPETVADTEELPAELCVWDADRDALVEGVRDTEGDSVSDELALEVATVEAVAHTDEEGETDGVRETHELTELEPHVEGDALAHALKLTDDELELCGPVPVAQEVSDADGQRDAGALREALRLESALRDVDGDDEPLPERDAQLVADTDAEVDREADEEGVCDVVSEDVTETVMSAVPDPVAQGDDEACGDAEELRDAHVEGEGDADPDTVPHAVFVEVMGGEGEADTDETVLGDAAAEEHEEGDAVVLALTTSDELVVPVAQSVALGDSETVFVAHTLGVGDVDTDATPDTLGLGVSKMLAVGVTLTLALALGTAEAVVTREGVGVGEASDEGEPLSDAAADTDTSVEADEHCDDEGDAGADNDASPDADEMTLRVPLLHTVFVAEIVVEDNPLCVVVLLPNKLPDALAQDVGLAHGEAEGVVAALAVTAEEGERVALADAHDVGDDDDAGEELALLLLRALADTQGDAEELGVAQGDGESGAEGVAGAVPVAMPLAVPVTEGVDDCKALPVVLTDAVPVPDVVATADALAQGVALLDGLAVPELHGEALNEAGAVDDADDDRDCCDDADAAGEDVPDTDETELPEALVDALAVEATLALGVAVLDGEGSALMEGDGVELTLPVLLMLAFPDVELLPVADNSGLCDCVGVLDVVVEPQRDTDAVGERVDDTEAQLDAEIDGVAVLLTDVLPVM